MAQFYDGQKVRIKSLREIEKISDVDPFGELILKGCLFRRDDMGPYCGQAATIDYKNADRAGGSASYFLKEFGRSWMEEWLEPLDIPALDIGDIGGLL